MAQHIFGTLLVKVQERKTFWRHLRLQSSEPTLQVVTACMPKSHRIADTCVLPGLTAQRGCGILQHGNCPKISKLIPNGSGTVSRIAESLLVRNRSLFCGLTPFSTLKAIDFRLGQLRLDA